MASWVYEQGYAAGLVLGTAKALLNLLKKRGIAVPDEARERILSCTDIAQLDAWIDRSAVVTRVEELFNEH